MLPHSARKRLLQVNSYNLQWMVDNLCLFCVSFSVCGRLQVWFFVCVCFSLFIGRVQVCFVCVLGSSPHSLPVLCFTCFGAHVLSVLVLFSYYIFLRTRQYKQTGFTTDDSLDLLCFLLYQSIIIQDCIHIVAHLLNTMFTMLSSLHIRCNKHFLCHRNEGSRNTFNRHGLIVDGKEKIILLV